jgi:hypothetical protein
MARFSQALLQGLLQPQMQQGLFETARNIGMTPSLMRSEQQRQERMQAFQNMTPVQQADFMVSQARTPQEVLAAQDLRRTAVEREGNSAIQPLITEVSNPETSDERAKELRKEIFDTARTYNMDESTIRKAYQAANERRILSEVEQLDAETREFAFRAKRALASNTSREAFVSQYGDEAGAVYDAEKEAQDLRDMQIQQAKENLRKSKYQYSDKILSSPPFSFSQAELDQVNAIAGGAAKNAMVLSIVTARSKPQNAALITVYAKAMYRQVAEELGLDLDDEDERPIIESEAYRRVLQASNTEGTKGIAGIVAQKQEQEAEATPEIDLQSAIDELVRELGNQPD